MNNTKAAMAVVAIGIAVVLISATGGFAEIGADRGVNVETATDGDAYVGVAVASTEITERDDEGDVTRRYCDVTVTATNQYSDDLEITVDPNGGSAETGVVAPGDGVTVHFEVDDGDDRGYTIHASATGASAGVDIEFDRSFSCNL